MAVSCNAFVTRPDIKSPGNPRELMDTRLMKSSKAEILMESFTDSNHDKPS